MDIRCPDILFSCMACLTRKPWFYVTGARNVYLFEPDRLLCDYLQESEPWPAGRLRYCGRCWCSLWPKHTPIWPSPEVLVVLSVILWSMLALSLHTPGTHQRFMLCMWHCGQCWHSLCTHQAHTRGTRCRVCDIVVNVGAVYEPSTHRYDHHQRYVLSCPQVISLRRSDFKVWLPTFDLNSTGLTSRLWKIFPTTTRGCHTVFDELLGGQGGIG